MNLTCPHSCWGGGGEGDGEEEKACLHFCHVVDNIKFCSFRVTEWQYILDPASHPVYQHESKLEHNTCQVLCLCMQQGQ